ncbi:MAG: glycosyltransferase family 2 protein [Acidimicrobiales bacterium]
MPAADTTGRATEDLARTGPAAFVQLLGSQHPVTTPTPADPAATPTAPGDAPADAPVLSVVLPVHNEQENLPELYRRLTESLAPVGRYELLFVDDGSRDASAGIVASFAAADPRVRLLRFSRNFGHQAAMAAGLDHARGRAVVMMDSDLQDPPEIIPELLAAWEDGGEVVYAVRHQRKEHALKRAAYHGFYRAVRWLSAPLDIPLDSGDFCLLDRRVVDSIVALSEQKTFLRGLRSWVGFHQVPLHYERHARFAGAPSYTFNKLRKLATDGIIACSSRPLRLASYLGFGTLAAAALYLLTAVGWFFARGTAPAGWTSLVALILVLGGAQLFVLGVLSEYVARIFDETRHRPNYVVAARLGFEPTDPSEERR